MTRGYIVPHPFSHPGKWICRNEDGTFYWGEYHNCHIFSNWFKAEAAYKTVLVRGMYNDIKKPNYMKLEGEILEYFTRRRNMKINC